MDSKTSNKKSWITFAIIGILAAVIIYMVLQNNKAPKQLSLVEQKRQELQNKRQTLEDKNQVTQLNSEIKQIEAALKGQEPPAPKQEDPYRGDASVNGTNVIMRKAPSTDGEKLGYFEPNEALTVVDMRETETQLEGKLQSDLPFFDNYNGSDNPKDIKITLPSNTAVSIDRVDYAQKRYDISYKHGDIGKVFTSLAFGEIVITNGKKWYKVQRKSGEQVWVFGKFLNVQNNY